MHIKRNSEVKPSSIGGDKGCQCFCFIDLGCHCGCFGSS